MKRTALKRRTPLKRKRSKPTKRAPRRVGREDLAYHEKVRALPCVLLHKLGWAVNGQPKYGCEGPTEVHHAGPKPGVGMKCATDLVHPFCRRHHREWTDHTGWFRRMTAEERRAFATWHISRTKQALNYDADPTRAGTSKEGK